MSHAQNYFLRTTTASISPLVLAFGIAANSGGTQALEYGCRAKEQIPALKAQMATESQVPVIKMYLAGRPDPISGQENWHETLFTMNIQTHDGYRLQRVDKGGICVSSKFKNIQLYRNDKLDLTAFMKVTGANVAGGGINRLLFSLSRQDGQNPMFRARESDPDLNLDKMTYIVGNPSTGEGALLSATHDGSVMTTYSKGIPSSSTANVDHGVEYTQSGKWVVDNKQSVAPEASAPRP